MNIAEAAIEAASLALHCDACTDDEHDACDRSDWEREARVALEAALPHLQPTEPLDRALGRLAALQSDPGERARRIEQAAMLEAAQVPDDLVPVMCKIAARGKILTDDLVAIERAGIMLGIEVQMPKPDDSRQGDDGEVILGELTIVNTLDEDGGSVRIRISDGLSWWDAIAMLSAASRSIDRVYEQGGRDA